MATVGLGLIPLGVIIAVAVGFPVSNLQNRFKDQEYPTYIKWAIALWSIGLILFVAGIFALFMEPFFGGILISVGSVFYAIGYILQVK